ncbi:MAG: response regulator [Desulfobulbaceae bacterium]|nr:response regulator [Desulfobulbaceae bacterium]
MSTILLVEDEILILDTTRELLKVLNHQVFTAATGAMALEVLAERKGQIDLVLLDLSLPDMNGYQLIPTLAEKYPELKIIICSGALPDELDFKDLPIVKGILNKPFEFRELREIVSNTVSSE